MALTKEFLKLFGSFVANYKQNGTPAFYNWSKEQNHSPISRYFDELLAIITKNQETIHDASIIENLCITILLSAKTNPYLLACWIDFLNEYNAAAKQYAPIGAIEISIGPSGVPSESMIRDLQNALISQQATFESTQKVHQAEVDQLRRQISDLQTANGNLRLENDQLKTLVGDQNLIEDIHPQIQTMQDQFLSFSKLLGTLLDVTKQKSVAETSTPKMTAQLSVHKQDVVKDLASLVGSVVEDSHNTKKDLPRILPVLPSAKDSKTEPQTALASQSFFTEPSKDQLLDGINSALEKMRKQKQERARTSQSVDEKKKLTEQVKVAHLSYEHS